MSNENAISIFEHEEFGNVRVLMQDDDPWFVAKDVCICLDIRTDTVNAILDTDEFSNTNSIGIRIEGVNRGLTIINESGLYSLILRSRKPEAKKFKKWVTSEVLPSIRKTGSYNINDVPPLGTRLPGSYHEALQDLTLAVQHINSLSDKLAIAIPKAARTDAVTTTQKTVSVGTFANILNQNGYPTGQNKFFQTLRKDGFLMTRSSRKNHPYQRFLDSGLFVIEEIYNEETNQVYYVTRITVKGQIYLVNRYLAKEDAKNALQQLKDLDQTSENAYLHEHELDSANI